MLKYLAASLHGASNRLALPRLAVWALLVPLLSTPLLARAYADTLAGNISLQLLTALAPVTEAWASTSEVPRDEEAILSETPVLRAAVHEARSHRIQRSWGASAVHGIRVSARQVLALAERRAMPQAVPVKANAYHPAGLLLRGVSALGIGMQDGDVLTEAAGQKASSVAAVVGVVLAARARLSPEISGRFYRAGVPFSVTVEQPYPKTTVPG
ncbi:MAG: hypothetical protein ABI488_07050 [Polyangiaceae bacterium]